jgi:hypothetical protein
MVRTGAGARRGPAVAASFLLNGQILLFADIDNNL